MVSRLFSKIVGSLFSPPRRRLPRRWSGGPLLCELLEPRQLLSAIPVATPAPEAAFHQSPGTAAVVGELVDRAPPQPAEKTWTVMIYMAADNDLEPYAIDDFREMARVGNPDVNIVVQLDRTPTSYSTAYGDWSGTRRYVVERGMTPTDQAGIDIGEQDMGDPQTLVEFVQWARTSYPAPNNALILWDHGGGWEEGVCVDESSSYDTLTMSELHSALSVITNNGVDPLQVVGMDACLMGQFEVAYELKGSSQFFVGAADLTLADGWEYQNILSSRHLSSTTDAATWSQYIVTAFKKAYDKFNVESTIMAADMSRIANVSESVASLSQTLVAALQPESSLSPETYSAVAASLAASRVYNFTEVDLFDFCDELQSRSTDSTIQADARAVMSSLAGGAESLITSSWADTRYAETTDGQRGLSAYFARTANPDYFYNRLYQSLDFAIDGPGQDWLDFWMAYLAIKYPSSSAAGMAASSVGTRGCRPGAAPLDGEFAAVYLAIGSSAGLGADAAGMTSVHAVPARVQTDGAGPGAGTEVRRPAVESWQSDASVVACVLPGNASRARLNAHRDALFQTLGAEDDQVGVTPWTDRNAWRLPFQDLVTPWLDGE